MNPPNWGVDKHWGSIALEPALPEGWLPPGVDATRCRKVRHSSRWLTRLAEPTESDCVSEQQASTAPATTPAEARVAGQHARATQRDYARRAVTAVVISIIPLVVAIVTLGFGWALVGVEVLVIAAVLAVDTKAGPRIDRWRRGAEGEEHVGRVVDQLRDNGWLALHDVQLGRGNIDHFLVGPGGIYTIETKSHRGRIRIKQIDPCMLKQAYAEAKVIERITGLRTEPLLVFSDAYLVPAVSRRNGVVILPARMLRRNLRQCGGNAPPARIAEVYGRLAIALSTH